MPARVSALGLALSALLCVLSGCGDSSEEGAKPGDAMLGHLPASPRVIASVDLAGVRRALDLPADEDPSAQRIGERGTVAISRRRFAIAAARALPHLASLARGRILEVLDHGRITAAVTGGLAGRDQITVIRTGQPASEVLDGLAKAGYRRRGGLVATDRALAGASYGAATEVDGLIVLGEDRAQVTRAAERTDGGGGPAGELLRDLAPGPVRVAQASSLGGNCLKAFGGSDRLSPAAGELVLRTGGVPDPERVVLDDRGKVFSVTGSRFEAPKVDGRLVRLPYRYRGAMGAIAPAISAGSDIPVTELYDCP